MKKDLSKQAILYIFLLCSCLLCMNSLIANSTQAKIQAIDPLDRQKLQDFFQSLFLEGDFAYTLFGSKPMGSIDYLAISHTKEVTTAFVGWQVWKKYQHLFPLSNFAISYCDQIDTIGFFDFFIINKSKCCEVINRYLPLFKSCFSFQTPNDLVESLCSPNFFAYTGGIRPKNYYLCLGLLFGYGEKSATLFERRMQLFQQAAQYPYDLNGLNDDDKDIIYGRDKNKLRQQENEISLKSLIQELNDFRNNQVFNKLTTINNPLFLMRINGFVSFGDEPLVENLQAEHDKLRAKLMEIYYSENFLEIVLNRLMAP